MARDQEPITAAEIEQLRAVMAEQRQAIREDLANELGGDPADYAVDRPVADGSD